MASLSTNSSSANHVRYSDAIVTVDGLVGAREHVVTAAPQPETPSPSSSISRDGKRGGRFSASNVARASITPSVPHVGHETARTSGHTHRSSSTAGATSRVARISGRIRNHQPFAMIVTACTGGGSAFSADATPGASPSVIAMASRHRPRGVRNAADESIGTQRRYQCVLRLPDGSATPPPPLRHRVPDPVDKLHAGDGPARVPANASGRGVAT